MIDLNPEIVCQIIERAREFQSKEAVVLTEIPSNPTENWAMQSLANHANDMTYQEVITAVADLEPDQQVSLVALMWLGRGDYVLEEWEAAIEDAKDGWTERTAEYLLATPMVSDYLLEGLYLHDYSCD
ncbi:MAG: DUF3775 domain-containing protein [Pseudomonadota bacterium]